MRGQPFSGLTNDTTQQAAILSWRQAGLNIISVHTHQELLRYPAHLPNLESCDIEVLQVSQTLGSFPECLPNLRHTCQLVAKLNPEATFCFTNADIIFSNPFHVRSTIDSLDDDVFLIANRLDTADLGRRPQEGVPYRDGFDFFVTSASLLSRAIRFLPDVLTFGLPWWDLYFPLAHLAVGASLIVDSPHFYWHELHDERWGNEFWGKIGMAADAEFLQLISQYQASIPVNHWPSIREKAIAYKWVSRTTLSRAKRRLRSLIIDRALFPPYLSEIAEALMTKLLLAPAGRWNNTSALPGFEDLP